MSGERMVRFGENVWIRASQIESVAPKRDGSILYRYQVEVRMIGGRKWTYDVSSTTQVGTSGPHLEAQERAEAKRDAYLHDFLLRMGV